MICGKCNQTIQPDEKYTEHPIDAGSAASPTVYWHTVCPPRQ